MSEPRRSSSRSSHSVSSNPFRSTLRDNLPSFSECFEGYDQRRLAHLGETVMLQANSPQQWRSTTNVAASALAGGHGGGAMRTTFGSPGSLMVSPLPGSPTPTATAGGYGAHRVPVAVSPYGGGGASPISTLSMMSPLQPSPRRRFGTEEQRSAPATLHSARSAEADGAPHQSRRDPMEFSTTSLPLSEEDGENYTHNPPQTPPRRIERDPDDESLLPTPILPTGGGPMLPPLHPGASGGLSPPPWGPTAEHDLTEGTHSSPPSTSPHRGGDRHPPPFSEKDAMKANAPLPQQQVALQAAIDRLCQRLEGTPGGHDEAGEALVTREDLALLLRQVLVQQRTSAAAAAGTNTAQKQRQYQSDYRTRRTPYSDEDPWWSVGGSGLPTRSLQSTVDALIPPLAATSSAALLSGGVVSYRRRDFAYYQPDFGEWSRPAVTRAAIYAYN